MVDIDLAYTPATELARLIRAKEVSPVELVRNSLARIEEVNPKLNGFCFVYPEEAMEKARSAEEAVTKGDDLGPLHGIPVAVKDFTPTKGKTTTLGSKVFEHWVPERNALVVTRILAAGAILVGKTATPEFAHSSFTDSPLWGPTRNPWDPSRTPGGSSGGSAVAVATGCVPLAEGSDAGGSVRIPAALSGVVGLKPSFGRIPMDALATCFDTLFHFGPLARTVADAALFLDVTQGPDERDIFSLPRGPKIAVPPPATAEGLKLALSVDQGFYALDPEVEANTVAAARALRDAGARVEEVELGWTRKVVDDWFAHWAVFFAAFFGQYLDEWRDRMTPEVVRLIETGNEMSAVDFKRTELTRTEQWEALRPILESHDALLTATMVLPAPPLGGKDSDYDQNDEAGRYLGLDMTCPINFISPCPAISVPSGFTKGGLPTGLQIIGRRYDDQTVLRIAAAFEQARPWAQHRPPV